ncbi:MAG: hypothetical protein EBY35_13885 [Rhodobacteraceae bacterium]|nr:hypothetical protein [Paracoccaceae bacterium]
MLTVYLSGEIHTDWRDQIVSGANDLNVIFTGPVTDHEASDVVMHGAEHQHALKEVDAAALAVVESPNQVVEILNYVLNGTLPSA